MLALAAAAGWGLEKGELTIEQFMEACGTPPPKEPPKAAPPYPPTKLFSASALRHCCKIQQPKKMLPANDNSSRRPTLNLGRMHSDNLMQADLGSPFGETPCSGNSAGVNYTNLPLEAPESSGFFNHGLPAPSPKPLPPQRQVSHDFNDITNNYDRTANMTMLIGNMSRMSSDESFSVLTSAENSRQGYNSLCNTPRESLLTVKVSGQRNRRALDNFGFLTATPRYGMTLQQMKDKWSGLYASCDAESMSSLDFDYFVGGLVEIRNDDPSFMRCMCCVTANQAHAGTHECTECRDPNTRELKSKKS